MTQGTLKAFVPARFKDREGDNTKRAYVEFYAYDEKTNGMKRKQIFCPSKFRTKVSRERWANEVIQHVNKLLEEGKYFRSIVNEKFQKTPSKPIIDTFTTIVETRKATLRKRSYDTFKSALKKLEAFLISKSKRAIPIQDFNTPMLSEYTDYCLSIGNSPRTINNTLEQIGWFFEQAIEKGYIEVKPYKRKKLKETASNTNVAFTPHHQKLLEDYLIESDYPLYLFTRFLYHAFIRPRELRQIKTHHIDFVQCQLFVKGFISKNRKNEGVTMNRTLLGLAKQFEGKEGFLFGKDFELCSKLQMSDNYAYNRHVEALKRLDLEGYGYTLYSWKHTGAVRAYQSGIDIKKLQRLLRHSSLTITDIYLRSLNVITNIENLAGW